MFTIDTESGFDQVVFITASYGLGETVVQGAVNPDEFYVYKPNVAAGLPAILSQEPRRQGDQDGLRRRSNGRGLGRDRRRAARGPAAFLDQRRGGGGARALRDRHRAPLRPADGHRVGSRRRRRQALHPAGAAGDGEVAGIRRRAPAPLPARQALGSAGERPRHRAEDRAGHRAPDQVGDRDGARRRRRRAGHRHDRPGLGADHEARRGHRHQPRRPDLPRGDHRARARHSRGRRLRRRDAHADRRRQRHGFLRRGRHRSRLRGPARGRGRRRCARHDAAGADQDHDERRQPRARLRVQPAAQRGRGPGAAGVHHRPQRRRASEGAARIRRAAGGAQGNHRGTHRGLPGPGRVLRQRRSSKAWRPSPRRSGRRR